VPPARRLVPLALAALAGALVAGVALALPSAVDGPGDGARPASRVAATGDVASIYNVGPLQADLERLAIESARAAGAAATPARSASIGALQITRAGAVVDAPPSGLRIPFTVTSMPPAALLGMMGRDVSGVLRDDTLVMGATTAGLRGAQAGDRVDLVAADGSVRTMTIAGVLPDDRIGGTELLMTDAAAGSLGITTSTRVVIWGIGSRPAFDAAVAAAGLPGRRETRIIRSWDPPNPDSTLSTSQTKALLGEFAYAPTAGDSIVQEAAWQAANLPPGRELLSNAIPIRARCHVRLAGDLRAALDEIAASGLSGAIDVANANTYGGCHNPRYNRINGELGVISRHAWAQALDVNTVTNCQGCRPQMNCDVVRIFRKHGFAWGGNFLRTDGMHFEWVGERRDQVAGPSRYCPNAGQPLLESAAAAALSGDAWGELLAEDPLELAAHDHDHDH
jgi:hypothetical protein